ncbi:MAG: 3-dehydroquinate synthase [Bdellovibrionaceae bacterium]|nr:3-dehydroquinate synthase [Pseudobdellovibrionaceae bacterium]
MYNNFKSEIIYQDTFTVSPFAETKDLLIYDQRLHSFLSPHLPSWQYKYALEAGEDLKEFSTATKIIEKLCEYWGTSSSRQSRIIVCGGGSIGDFAGFFASILKRGVQLVQIPSTWLAAIDSAHGGKTGLNIHKIKNQLGTFYPAHQVYLFKDLLFYQPEERAQDAFGECLKMMLMGPIAWDDVNRRVQSDLFSFLWDQLPSAIEKKYQIVLEDPYELTGKRKWLNLGHTFGHVLESVTGKGHGLCVLQGLRFSLGWSVRRGYCSSPYADAIENFIHRSRVPVWQGPDFKELLIHSQLEKLLQADKKSQSDREIDFVFIGGPENVFVQKVKISDVIEEVSRQGWIIS